VVQDYQEPHADSYNDNATLDLPANFFDNLYPGNQSDYFWNGSNEESDQRTNFSFYCRKVRIGLSFYLKETDI